MYAMSNSADYLRMYEAGSKAEYYQIFERLVRHISLEGGMTNAALMEESRDFRQNHRRDWWRLQLYKLRHYWTPWLNPLIFSRGQFLISLFAATPLFLISVIELWRGRGQRDPFIVLMLGLVVVGFLVGGFLFHVQVRYRVPFVDVTFLLLTASFLGQFDVKRAYRLVTGITSKRQVELIPSPADAKCQPNSWPSGLRG
jgi:hypothetical protein